MMAGAGEARKATERKPTRLDVGVPFVKRSSNYSRGREEAEDGEDGEGTGQPKGMRFTLLTKKGSKQQVRRSLIIPRLR